MSEDDVSNSAIIDRDSLDADWPTQHHEPLFWQELGRVVAAFGFLEEMLGKAIFALTGGRKIDLERNPEAFTQWIKTLEQAITGQLGSLIISFENALNENDLTKAKAHTGLIDELKQAKDIRNVLCHGSWGLPDEKGGVVPKFVNRKLLVFETSVDIEFLQQTRKAVRELICDVLDSVTSIGYKFPGSESPGEQVWSHPAETLR